jgi:CelD/BcsL family acetyltransferase involved in cellulose biosynthesis
LRLVVLNEIPEDDELRRRWNALVLGAEQPQVFYTYEWALAVYRAYHTTLRPLLFLAYDASDSLCGVAALATDPAGRRVSFLCATTGDYCDFLGPGEQREDFVGAVLAELRKQNTREMALANLPADSATTSAIDRVSAAHGYHSFARTGYFCAQVLLSSIERRDGAKPVLPRKKMLRRFLNAMGREAPVRLDHARSWDEIEGVLPGFVQAHVARFLVTRRISNVAQAERRVFLAELAKLLSEPGWLVLTRMMSGKKAFAWNYGFRFQGTWFWYQPTFVSDLEKYSPGFCLLAKLIEEAADDPGLKVVDLGLGAEEYKDRFTNQTRETLYVTLHASAGRHYGEILRYRAAEILGTRPRAKVAAQALVGRWHRLKDRIDRDGFVATLHWVGARLGQLLWTQDEVFFYEWCGSSLRDSSPDLNPVALQPLDLNALASATFQYIDDRATLSYLLRAAARVQEGKAEGFGLVDAEGKFLHFAWAAAFEGFFLSELDSKVSAPSANCVMLFDCWTPSVEQGRGYYGQTVESIARRIAERGQRPWIFSASNNGASVRGLNKTGFQRRYSLVRQRLLGSQRIERKAPISQGVAPGEMSPGSEDSAA